MLCRSPSWEILGTGWTSRSSSWRKQQSFNLLYTLHYMRVNDQRNNNLFVFQYLNLTNVKATLVSRSSWWVTWNPVIDKPIVGVRDLCAVTACPWCWWQIRQATSWSIKAALSETHHPDRTFSVFENREIKSFFTACRHTESCHYRWGLICF